VLIQHTAVGDNGEQKTKISAIIVKFIMTRRMRGAYAKKPDRTQFLQKREMEPNLRAGSETHPQLCWRTHIQERFAWQNVNH